MHCFTNSIDKHITDVVEVLNIVVVQFVGRVIQKVLHTQRERWCTIFLVIALLGLLEKR